MLYEVITTSLFLNNQVTNQSNLDLSFLCKTAYAGCEITKNGEILFSCDDDPSENCNKTKMGYTLTCTKAKYNGD